MAIRVYGVGEHPSGFIGIRVTRSFAGQYRQAYFSFRQEGGIATAERQKSLMTEAEALEARWKKESEEHKYQSRLSLAHPNTKPGRSVGVEGITAEFAVDNSGQTRSYYYPGFRVSQPGPGSRAATHIRFSQHGYEGAWKAAVELWAERYSILPKDKKRILRNMPPREHFSALRKQMNKEGHAIPLEALDALSLAPSAKAKKTSKASGRRASTASGVKKPAGATGAAKLPVTSPAKVARTSSARAPAKTAVASRAKPASSKAASAKTSKR